MDAPDCISTAHDLRIAALSIGAFLLFLIGAGLMALTAFQFSQTQKRWDAESRSIKELSEIAVEGIVISDGDRIVSANKSLLAMAGVELDKLETISVSKLMRDPAAGSQLLHDEGKLDGELVSACGEGVPVEVVYRSVSYSGRPHRLIAFRDLRDRVKAEAEIRFLAHHDPLTGLANRASFQDKLGELIEARSRNDAAFAVLLLDLDRFKPVNDSLGHAIGDALLKKVAARLRSAVRHSDIVARLGGDEFAILQCRSEQPEGACSLAGRVIELLNRPFLVESNIISIGCSVGVALAPADGDDAVTLLKRADFALYRAKAEGRGCFSMFEAEMDAQIQTRRALEMELRQALARNEFELEYQPQINVASGAIVGFEALLRWRHPERGTIAPGEFIPLAEETGLILPIGKWILRTACQEALTWPGSMAVSVNLSPLQLRGGNLVETVEAILRQTGLDAQRLELEITENVILRDAATIIEDLNRLRGLGVRISMDDFGTGYSALSYLRSFQFDRIKIDRTFVAEALENSDSAAIIRAIVGLGKALGIATTAEGVETEDQLAYIRAEGCDEVQGYLTGRPITSQALAELLGAPIATEQAA